MRGRIRGIRRIVNSCRAKAGAAKLHLVARRSVSALGLARHLQLGPTADNDLRRVFVTFPTASAAVDRMIEAGILRESSGKRRGRLFLYGSYLDILNRES